LAALNRVQKVGHCRIAMQRTDRAWLRKRRGLL
jgi:hypothetical protein